MSDFFYYIFIFPLESILSFLLVFLYENIQSYGLSIIFLSFFINVFLLKIFILTDQKATAVADRKKNIDLRIQAWKKVYNKTKVFAFTQRLYKQEHYHPIYALSALGGLLIQIPFFYAMYFVIKNNVTLNGISFLWIKDLSAPDLIFGIHLLPILMTLISLINVWFIAKERGERVQGCFISLLFLFLLYQMPSALVLYWTANVFFSLVKTIFTKQVSETKKEKEHKENNSECKNSGIPFSWKYFFSLPQFLKCSFVTSFIILTIILLISSFIAIYGNFVEQKAEIIYVENESAKINYPIFSFILRSHSLSNVEIVNIHWNKGIHENNFQNIFIKGRYLNFECENKNLPFQKGETIGYLFYKISLIPLFKNIFLAYLVILCLSLLSMRFLYLFTSFSRTNALVYKKISNYSILSIVFLICVFNTFTLYYSDVHQFDPERTYPTLFSLFGFFILFFFLIKYTLSLISKKLDHFVSFCLSLILFVGLSYSFILVGDYGALDRFVFQQVPPIFANSDFFPQQAKEFFIVLMLGIALISFNLERMLRAWQLVFFSLVVVSAIKTFGIVASRNPPPPPAETTEANQKIDGGIQHPFSKELFSYSKTNKNIVVFVLDMFSGSHMPYILENYPELKDHFEGFTFFPNTISSSNGTVYSMPSVVAGEYYTIYNQNKRRDNRAKAELNAFQSIGSAFADNGYAVGYLMYPLENKKELFKENKFFWLDNYTELKKYFLEKHAHLKKLADSAQDDDIAKLLSFGLFKFSPEIYRKYIYNNALWLPGLKKIDFNAVFSSASTVYAPTHIGNTRSVKPTFKFFHTSMTHPPHGMFYDARKNMCNFGSLASVWKNKDYDQLNDWQKNATHQHMDSELCALSYLGDYIQWLKKEDIYDNTQIFIVSDHGGYKDSIDVPTLQPRGIGPDTIFLFKDFNAKGDLKTDTRLMGNFDIATIYCDNLTQSCPRVGKNILQNYPSNREIIHACPGGDFGIHPADLWLIEKTYKAVGHDITNKNNWIDITHTSNIANFVKAKP